MYPPNVHPVSRKKKHSSLFMIEFDFVGFFCAKFSVEFFFVTLIFVYDLGRNDRYLFG